MGSNRFEERDSVTKEDTLKGGGETPKLINSFFFFLITGKIIGRAKTWVPKESRHGPEMSISFTGLLEFAGPEFNYRSVF